MRKKHVAGICTAGKKALYVLAGIVSLNMGIMTMALPEVRAFASYDSMVYYTDVVKSSQVLKSMAAEEKVNDTDDNKIMDHTECWGTRDCIEVTMPEDGTLKLHMKNTSGYWMYGSQLEIYTNKNLSHKLSSASISVDGGGEGDSSIYLEKGTYYIFVTSSNYEGNEFVEGEPHLSRRTEVWAGYVAQEPIFSLQSMNLSEDKSSATITLNLPTAYSTLRVEDYYIDYEDLRNGTKWETDSRANMLEYNTYTVKKNGWYTFRLALNSEDKDTKGWGYLCHVKVDGIGGKAYKELDEATDNLPEITIDGETKVVPSISSYRDFKKKINEEMEPVYSVHAYRQTVKNFSVNMKEAGSLCISGYSQARNGTYNNTTVKLYADKKRTMEIGSVEISGAKTVTWSLLPGTYYVNVTTSGNSSELNDTEYAERSFYLYAGCIASKQVMSQDVTLSEDKSGATIKFHFAKELKGVTYYLYDYKVNKWQLVNQTAGATIKVDNSTLEVTKNGEYTVYIKGVNSKDYPSAYIDTFCVTGIDGKEYEKETKAAPLDEIPYAYSSADLLDNVAQGQEPFLTIPYTAWDVCSSASGTSKCKKITFEEDTYIHTYVGGTGGVVKFYRDFQCTDLYKTLNADSRADNRNIKAGTYYVYFQANGKGVGSYDGAYYYAQAQLYIGGVKNSDLVTMSELDYNKEKSQVTFSLQMLNNETIGAVRVYDQHYERGDTIKEESLVATSQGASPISLNMNGEYTLLVYAKNTANMGQDNLFCHITVEGLSDQTQDNEKDSEAEERQNPEEGKNREENQNPEENGNLEEEQSSKENQILEEGQNSEKNQNFVNEQTGGIYQNVEPDGLTDTDEETDRVVQNDRDDDTVEEMPKGSVVVVKGLQYKVTQTAKNATVSLIGVEKESVKNVVIPNSIKVEGKTYMVTEISKNALKGNRKLVSVTIGKNVTKIGKNACKGCKNLKKITIKSTKIKTIGSGAFKGIHKKAAIKVPRNYYDNYKKIFKKAVTMASLSYI